MRTAATAHKRDRGDRGGLGGTSSDGDADEDGGEDGNECSGGDVDVGGSCQGRVPVSASWEIGRSTVSRTADGVASFNAGSGASRAGADGVEDGGNGGRPNLPTRPATTAGGGGGSDGDGDGTGGDGSGSSDIGGAARGGAGPAAVTGAA